MTPGKGDFKNRYIQGGKKNIFAWLSMRLLPIHLLEVTTPQYPSLWCVVKAGRSWSLYST